MQQFGYVLSPEGIDYYVCEWCKDTFPTLVDAVDHGLNEISLCLARQFWNQGARATA